MFKWRNIKEARKADDGAILAIWGVSFAALLGIVAMSFDMGRIGITQSELQSYADNVALAAAGELDGTASAITRATGAAANLITDTETFGNANNTLQGAGDYALTFLSDLPASDLSATTSVTANPADAAFVRVDVINHTVDLTFGAAFTALTGNAAPNNVLAASAIAGFTQYACDITPLMFCLPDPSYTANGNIGDLINLRSGGNGAAWGAGDFGFLDPSNFLIDPAGPCGTLSGVQLDNCLIGAEGPITQCFKQNGVDIEPGQKVGIKAIFNVRFDMYNATMINKKNDPNYPPAPGVIKGVVPQGGGFCIGNNQQPSPDTLGLPQDNCFGSGTCGGGGRFGDGNWSTGRTNYVATNYAGVDPHPTATTRYQYYLDEITEAGGAASSLPILIGLAETGRPACSNNQSIDVDRRTVIAAGVDCVANPINGAEVGVPVKEFFKLFITEPVRDSTITPPVVDIWVEVVGSASAGTGGTGGVFHDVVQIYR